MARPRPDQDAAQGEEEDEVQDADGFVVEDPGIADERLMVIEDEFAQALKVMSREGNTLSPALRALWDRGDLGNLTKTSPARTTGALVSIIGHIPLTNSAPD